MRRDACKWKVNYPPHGMETLALLAPNYANSAQLESKFSVCDGCDWEFIISRVLIYENGAPAAALADFGCAR
jgi:hypothetical protein